MTDSLKSPDLHPSQFQNNISVSNNIKSTRTLISLTNERKNVFQSDTFDISKLEPQKSFNLTSDDKSLSGSNTRFLFKNLYGETPLTFLFFSKDNIDNIQNLTKMLVYKQMNYTISNQNITDLHIIMRSVFLSYSEHPPLLDETMAKEKIDKLKKLYTKEVDRLNTLVIDIVVPKVCSGVQAYLDYLRDSSSGLRTIPRSVNTSVAGTKQFRSITNILTGSSL